MGYQQGLSGLSAASSDLDVIGNNIANANTIGFKSGTAVFADLYANSVATAVNNQIGIGTQLAAVQQQFSQGTINSTGTALDVAINGNGFFQMSNNGAVTYSRNGVFQLNSSGQIVNAEGLQVMGYAANAGGIINSAQTVPLTVPTTNIAPSATTSITAQFNLNAQDALMLGTPTAISSDAAVTANATITTASAGTNNDTYTVTFDGAGGYTISAVTPAGANVPALASAGAYTLGQAIPPITLGNGQTVTVTGAPVANDTVIVSPAPIAFNQNSPSTYNYTSSVPSYDTLGGSQTVNMYFAKTDSNTWNVYAGVAGGAAQIIGQAQFSTSGTLSSFQQATIVPGPPATVTYAPPAAPGTVTFQIPNSDGSSAPQTLSLNLTGTTQYGSTDGTNNLSQNGYAAGQLTNFSIGTTGVLTGNYSNGQTAALGQIVLANFNNPNGLVDLGNNEYQQTAQSGVAQISTPGSTNHGTLQGGAVEESNVDLTNELVNLITAQRNYQANAQTIKTQQTVDQTLINL
ncbi:flagellar biosynthesis protein FlgE [Paraburkholderia phytofirmans OLGA172]|uniref:Flagellar hook protein FlgE n=1 Tax=Paraburkholderia phytofirmans OLGA172 TaxID=1417228 RepID=A0A160FP41_9BURK|nr:flagellar hook protein FlgE [Paraburkholderia phytofirmans]ANB74324.1 flagellar biosynthesis protein FlgE [Paraburkholderia phytofirmans OLGA172]